MVVPSDLKTNQNAMLFCANATCGGTMEEVMIFRTSLSERNCSITDYHFSPRGYSTPAFSRAMDRKTTPHMSTEHQARALVETRKAVKS